MDGDTLKDEDGIIPFDGDLDVEGFTDVTAALPEQLRPLSGLLR